MVVDIKRMGDPKTCPDHSSIPFEDLQEYTLAAKKLIAAEAPKIKTGLAQEVLADADALSRCVEAVIQADWRWDGHTGTKYGYRKQRVIWTLQNWVSRQAKIKSKQTASLNMVVARGDGKDLALSDVLPSGQPTPLQEAIAAEELGILDTMLGHLNERERQIVEMYYLEGKVMAEIGEEFGCSRQRVDQILKRAVSSLQELAHVYSK